MLEKIYNEAGVGPYLKHIMHLWKKAILKTITFHDNKNRIGKTYKSAKLKRIMQVPTKLANELCKYPKIANR